MTKKINIILINLSYNIKFILRDFIVLSIILILAMMIALHSLRWTLESDIRTSRSRVNSRLWVSIVWSVFLFGDNYLLLLNRHVRSIICAKIFLLGCWGKRLLVAFSIKVLILDNNLIIIWLNMWIDNLFFLYFIV